MRVQTVTLIANGDLRLAANQKAWPMQEQVEKLVAASLERRGVAVTRGHVYDKAKKHGLIDSQKHGMSVFRGLDPSSPLVVVLSTWQYSHHILAGLVTHAGPILTLANFSGTWPGLVGLLNLNASLTKAGKAYSTLWSEHFTDAFFDAKLDEWLRSGSIVHDESHVSDLPDQLRETASFTIGRELGASLQRDKAILGVFDEGCMGMYNAIVPDGLLHPTGLYKERLSQSVLYFTATQVPDSEADACLEWVEKEGLTFHFGHDSARDLTRAQVLTQMKMYIAALRIADDYGCSAIGIQYQQGLKDLMPASDLVEGLLNNVSRPPVLDVTGSRELFAGQALPHFNEVDECAGIDALVTNRVWTALGLDPENTLHDVRWGDEFEDSFVWVFEISGAVPAAHLAGGYRGASSMRQPPMYFRLGGGTLRGISKPGRIVWSRVYIEQDKLRADLGLATVADLPDEETERRWRATNYEWPIMHAILDGVSRDQFMARHKSNHVQVAYVPAGREIDALTAKAGMLDAMGIECFVCGL